LLDDAGKVVVAYAIPVNEHRGIYFAESTDGGVTWLRVFQVFDAVAAGWEIVDHPAISLTADGRLHVLFSQYTWRSTQRVSLGLYYSQSADGGVTWSVPSIVSDHPVLWSEIYSYDQSTVHRVWQEADTSTLFSFHQVSQDSGATWSDPVIISSIEDRPADLTAQAMDSAGNIHFLQLAGKNQIMIERRMWNGSRWISQASKDLSLSNRGIPSSITASVSSKGNLVVSVLVDYPEATDGLMANVLSVGKSIKLPQGGQTPQPAILVEAAEPTAVVTAESPEIGEPAANDVSVQDIKEPQSLLSENRNLVGLFLVGGILLSILVVFWPLSKKHADQKKISE
jgi:hypothetical protein